MGPKSALQKHALADLNLAVQYLLKPHTLACDNSRFMNFILADMMPSIQDFLMLLIIPLLEYIIYPHLQKNMNITIYVQYKRYIARTVFLDQSSSLLTLIVPFL